MKLVKSNKNENSRHFLNTKFCDMSRISQINSSYNKIKSNKNINNTKNSKDNSFPLIIKEENFNKNKINNMYKSQKYFYNKKVKRQLKLEKLNIFDINKSNKIIIPTNSLNLTNNIEIDKYNNFFSGKENDKSKDINDNLELSNINLFNNFPNNKKIKLSNKNPINILYNNAIPKKKYKIRNDLLLDNIIKEKELEFEKENKLPSDKILLQRFNENNFFIRKSKNKRPILNQYTREMTASIENKKNIPSVYNHYLNQTKNIYDNVDKSYSHLKGEITYDLIREKEKNFKKEEKVKQLLIRKYGEIEWIKDAITIKNIPIVENYLKTGRIKRKEDNKNIKKKKMNIKIIEKFK